MVVLLVVVELAGVLVEVDDVDVELVLEVDEVDVDDVDDVELDEVDVELLEVELDDDDVVVPDWPQARAAAETAAPCPGPGGVSCATWLTVCPQPPGTSASSAGPMCTAPAAAAPAISTAPPVTVAAAILIRFERMIPSRSWSERPRLFPAEPNQPAVWSGHAEAEPRPTG
ncbi:MAG TPA: hypothetical protein VFJ85_02140 [Acidimicrobiales bacterium]|nr:hypothetical protein [Acidimicrobiales bacterium]